MMILMCYFLPLIGEMIEIDVDFSKKLRPPFSQDFLAYFYEKLVNKMTCFGSARGSGCGDLNSTPYIHWFFQVLVKGCQRWAWYHIIAPIGRFFPCLYTKYSIDCLVGVYNPYYLFIEPEQSKKPFGGLGPNKHPEFVRCIKAVDFYIKGTIPRVPPFSRWWFQIFFICTPISGMFPIWRAYFSDGLKPPTSFLYDRGFGDRSKASRHLGCWPGRQGQHAAGAMEVKSKWTWTTKETIDLGKCWKNIEKRRNCCLKLFLCVWLVEYALL